MSRRLRPWLGLLALTTGAALLTEAPARAETSLNNGDGMNTRLFRGAVDSKGFFGVNGTDVLGKGDLAFGLVLDGGFGILRTKTKDPSGADVITKLISSQFHGMLWGMWSPINNLTIGLGLPVDLVAGDPPGAAVAGAAGSGIADIKTNVNAFFSGTWQLNAKYRVLRVEDAPLGMAVLLSAELPLSTDAKLGYASDPGFTITPTVAFEKRFGSGEQPFRIGLNIGASVVTGAGSFVGNLESGEFGKKLTHGTTGRVGLGLSYRIGDVDLVAETYSSYLLKNDAGGSAGLSAEAIGGLKIFVERNSYLFLGGGVGYLKGYQAANQRGVLGFIFEPSIGDRDGDGIKDDVDKCPDEPEDRDGFKDEDGCPDPDNDGDGIPDKLDACPNEPETMNGIMDEDGCPDGVDGDRDKDGIPDSKDKCPDVPEDKDGFEDEDGCPDPDNDKDGILDKDDKCPNEPEDKDGFEDADGCPDPDNDHDGILDKDDKCPNEPETFNGFEDEDGCPDKGKVLIDGSTLVILDKVEFDYNSTKIKDKSMPIIDAVAATLKGHPEFTLLEVQGHADERGDEGLNLRLTQGRVDSVMAAMISRGVEKSRLRAKGFGKYCPIDDGHSEPAWEKNRRVEFKILKTKEGPTGVKLGCDMATSKGVKSDPVP